MKLFAVPRGSGFIQVDPDDIVERHENSLNRVAEQRYRELGDQVAENVGQHTCG